MIDVQEKRMTIPATIPAPTPTDIEEVLAGMMDGTGAFVRWVRLDEDDPEAEDRMAYTMWWCDVIGLDTVPRECCGGGATPSEAAAAAWIQACLGPWWYERHSDNRQRNLSKEEYLSVPRRVPEGFCFELLAVPGLGFKETRALIGADNLVGGITRSV